MAGSSPSEAVEAVLDRIRSTLGCISTTTAYVSYVVPDEPASLTVYAEGQPEPGRIRLTTHGGEGDLYLRLAHAFTILHLPDDQARGPYKIVSSYYQYLILDFAETEIVAYDWHPVGSSTVRTPHLHISALGSVVLEQRRGSRLKGRKTYLGSMHLPTGPILIEDVVELLIREFRVDPLRDDWRAVLDGNRQAIVRGNAW